MTITRSLVLLLILGLATTADAQLAGLTLERPAGQAPAAPGGGDPDPVLAGARIIVLPFRNISGDTDTGWIGDGIVEALATDLQPIADAAVIDRDGLAAALRGLGLPDAGALSRTDALAIGCRAGARWLINGGYQRVGQRSGSRRGSSIARPGRSSAVRESMARSTSSSRSRIGFCPVSA